MINSFFYEQPVKIHFGWDKLKEIESVLDEIAAEKCVIVCGKSSLERAERLMNDSGRICGIFSDIRPNPLLSGAAETAELIKKHGADTVIALGGGSAIDSAKYSAACAFSEHTAYEHFLDGIPLPEKGAKLIAIPTTAGTGSEVTKVSVISHENEKRSIHNPVFMPDVCIVDPALTMSVPKKTTMITGLDAFTHAIEAYWSKNHQPITDLYATESIRLILGNLEKSYEVGDRESRTNMAYASLLAGLAFSAAKTAASHACSFPISAYYHLPHGEACAFTLDSLIRINADERLEALAKIVGFENTDALADEINWLKRLSGLAMKLSDVSESFDIDLVSKESAVHPLMANNPVSLSAGELKRMFEALR